MRRRKITEVEERDLIESTERGEWVSVGNIEEQRAFWKKAARRTLEGKRRRISISSSANAIWKAVAISLFFVRT